ncbi:MAG: hypothetical protein LBM09_00070 [Candidatus Nomurabacteria bacterium]|jgi:uncharacterized membrane protein|nr:hypothetical protein [Candidatus Nomurabacteria bacterium]
MLEMKNIIAIISFAIIVIISVPYIKDIVKRRVRPERISWLLWTLLGATYLVGAIKTDGAVIVLLADFLVTAITFILVLKFGVGGKSWFDKISLSIALLAFILMLALNDGPIYGLALAIFVDLIGSILTIRKLRRDPASERKYYWGMLVISELLAVASLNVYSVENLLFPVYAVIINTIIFCFIKKKAPKSAEKAIEKF